MTTSDTPSSQEFNIGGVKHITPDNAYSALKSGDAIMIDVREEYEYMVEFISLIGVYHLPMSSIMDNLHNIPKDKPVITVCTAGVRSAKVTNMLKSNGFPDSINLDGGLHEWKEKGLPYETILPDACNHCHGSCNCTH